MNAPARWHVTLSRRANGLRGGDPDIMLCAALHREGSYWSLLLDIPFLWWTRHHCRDMSNYEHERHASGPGLVRLLEERHPWQK